MTWHVTGDIAVFLEYVRHLLLTDPVANTTALTVTDSLTSGHRFSDEPPVFAWCQGDSGDVTGAVLMTPPYDLMLAVVPPATVDSLVTTLRKHGVAVSGVRTADDSGDAFAAAWTAGMNLVPQTSRRLRLFRLGTLTPPDPAPPGHARPATMADSSRVTQWWDAYQREAEVHRANAAALAEGSIGAGLLWLWVDQAGEPVSMAAHKAPVGGASLLAPVYTPPQHRSRGYGAAVTAACTAGVLAAGATNVVLFTDLSNPVSNLIYRRIGFRPVSDARTIAFVPAP